MMPDASASPSAFTVSLAAPSLPPIAAIFPPVTPRSPCTGALPAPSWISASLMTRSNILAPPNLRHGVTRTQPFPGPLAPKKAMSDANGEALPSLLCSTSRRRHVSYRRQRKESGSGRPFGGLRTLRGVDAAGRTHRRCQRGQGAAHRPNLPINCRIGKAVARQDVVAQCIGLFTRPLDQVLNLFWKGIVRSRLQPGKRFQNPVPALRPPHPSNHLS